MKKISEVLLRIFAYGIVGCLFAGGISLLGYTIAIAIGGESATELCIWIYKVYLPCVIKMTSLFTGIGLVGMYLSKQKAFTVVPENEK